MAAAAKGGAPRRWPGFAPEAIGHRVVVRRSLAGAGPPYGDVLGLLLASDATRVLVRTRSGEVSVALDTVVAARLVGAARGRRVARLAGGGDEG